MTDQALAQGKAIKSDIVILGACILKLEAASTAADKVAAIKLVYDNIRLSVQDVATVNAINVTIDDMTDALVTALEDAVTERTTAFANINCAQQ